MVVEGGMITYDHVMIHIYLWHILFDCGRRQRKERIGI